MAWYKCGGGGALSETVLWTNPSPTSAQEAGTINLSDNLSNYKYVKIYWRLSINNSTTQSTMLSTDDFVNFTSDGRPSPRIAVSVINSSSTSYTRFVYYQNDAEILLASAIQYGTTTRVNANAIVTKISGLK